LTQTIESLSRAIEALHIETLDAIETPLDVGTPKRVKVGQSHQQQIDDYTTHCLDAAERHRRAAMVATLEDKLASFYADVERIDAKLQRNRHPSMTRRGRLVKDGVPFEHVDKVERTNYYDKL